MLYSGGSNKTGQEPQGLPSSCLKCMRTASTEPSINGNKCHEAKGKDGIGDERWKFIEVGEKISLGEAVPEVGPEG